jgi:hypothetical protein
MTYNIQFDYIGFNDKKEKGIEIEFLSNIIDKYLANNLKISNLRGIVFSSKFKETVERFQKESNDNDLGITENAAGEAHGKAIQAGNDYIVILSEYVLKGLLNLKRFIQDRTVLDDLLKDDQIVSYVRMLNVFHHELCHVHDGNINKLFYEKFSEYCNKNQENCVNYYNAFHFWREYIASYFSIQTLPKSANYLFGDVLSEYHHISLQVNELKRQYLGNIYNHGVNAVDKPAFFNNLFNLVSQFASFCCYTLGVLSADVINNQKRAKIISANLSMYFPIEAILELAVELQKLQLIYPNWNDVHILKPLSDTWLKLFQIFDIHVSLCNGGFRYDLI